MKKPYPILFCDAEGKEMRLSSCMKLEELIKMGATIKIVRPEEPLAPDEYRSVDEILAPPSK